MKSLILICLSLGLLNAGAAVPKLMQDWLSTQSSLKNKTVRFVQEKSGGVLKKPIKTPGQLWKGPASQFRWELGEPPKSVLVFDGKTMNSYNTRKREWTPVKMDDRKYSTLLGFLGARKMPLSEIERDFEIRENGTSGNLVNFALIANSGFVRNKIKQIDLQINPSTKLLQQLRILAQDDSQTIVSMSVPTSATLPAKAFRPE